MDAWYLGYQASRIMVGMFGLVHVIGVPACSDWPGLAKYNLEHQGCSSEILQLHAFTRGIPVMKPCCKASFLFSHFIMVWCSKSAQRICRDMQLPTILPIGIKNSLLLRTQTTPTGPPLWRWPWRSWFRLSYPSLLCESSAVSDHRR